MSLISNLLTSCYRCCGVPVCCYCRCYHVQCRGSIPLLWTQIPNIKYKPPTKLLEGSATQAAFDAHFDALLDKYKVREGQSEWMCE